MTYMTVRPSIRPNRNLFSREIDNWFEDLFGNPRRGREEHKGFAPNVNIDETDGNIVLLFELPGMDKKDIKVTLQDGVLAVSGKRELKSECKDDSCVRREIRSGEFHRSFTLPETVNADNIVADYNNGMLEIKLAKLEAVKPKEIEVKVS